jgi:hypothetical protein
MLFQIRASKSSAEVERRKYRRIASLGGFCVVWAYGFPLLIMVGIAIDAIFYSSQLIGGWHYIVILLAMVGNFIGSTAIGNALLYKSHVLEDQLRKERATFSGSRPALVCRSFDPGGLAYPPACNVGTPRHRHRRNYPSYLEILARALGDSVDLFAVGGPKTEEDLFNETNCLYFQTLDQDWENAFLLAAHMSRFIFLVPGVTPGIILEMRTLRTNNLANKTITLMPPQPLNRGYVTDSAAPYTDRDHFPTLWKQTADVWRRDKFDLPEYKREGAVFTVDSQGHLLLYQTLDSDIHNLGHAVSELLPAIPQAGSEGVTSELMMHLRKKEIPLPKPSRIQYFFMR